MKKIFTLFIIAFAIKSSAQYIKLLDFNGANGSYPYGDLFSDGTFLYGMTDSGGVNNKGTIFKIKTDGTSYSTLHDFAGGTDGSYPWGSLISDGTFLYGITSGGFADYCNIFKIMPNGTGYDTLKTFGGSISYSSLVYDGTFLYGMAWYDNTYPKGMIYKIKPDGSAYDTVLTFNGVNGNSPYGSLIYDGTFLYGMTYLGGMDTSLSNPCAFSLLDGSGVVFKIKPDGTAYDTLVTFRGANGSNPFGSLYSDGNFLYGMTNWGGTNCWGNVFKIYPNGSGFSNPLDFSGMSSNGASPYGSLISDGTFLYGMTSNGGTGSPPGIIFKVKPDGTGYANLFDFNSTYGGRPNGSLISDGIFLYGMTYEGGANNMGVIFKYQNAYIKGNTTICSGQSAILTALGGTSYLWNSGATTSSITVSPTTSTIYSVTATAGTFSTTVTTTVTVDNISTTLSLVPDTANPLLWYGYDTITGGTPPYNYFWDFGDGNTSTLAYPTHTYSVIGNYIICVTVTDTNSCTSSTCDTTYKISSTGMIQTLNIVTPLTGIESLQNTNDISIYPNPASDLITINYKSKTSRAQFDIIDITGRKILSTKQKQIDVSKLPQGLYLVKVKDGDLVFSKKFLKE